MTKSTIWTIERKVRNSYVYKHVNKTFLDWYVKFSLHITKKYMHTVHIYVDTVHARKHMPKWGNAKISNSRFSIGWIENRHIITMGWISKDRFIAPLWKLRCVGVEFQLLFFSKTVVTPADWMFFSLAIVRYTAHLGFEKEAAPSKRELQSVCT